MSALPVSILELAQKVNRINNDKVNHHVGFNWNRSVQLRFLVTYQLNHVKT